MRGKKRRGAFKKFWRTRRRRKKTYLHSSFPAFIPLPTRKKKKRKKISCDFKKSGIGWLCAHPFEVIQSTEKRTGEAGGNKKRG